MPDAVALAFALALLYSQVIVEAVLTARAAGLRFAGRLWRGIAWVAATPVRAVWVPAAVAWIGRLALMPLLGIRAPQVTDEHSYLLAAGTFLRGHLVNPPHPLWEHFETMHVLVQPVYASGYPPLGGAVLAIGQLLGHPWIGVWLSCGLMCAAIAWALGGWLPPKWAALGGLLVAVRLGWFSYWMNSYWGGAIAAAGGALLIGGFGRYRRTACASDAAWMGVGCILLIGTRPYEGLWLGLGIAIALLPRLRPSIWPAAVLVLLGAAGMAFYCKAVTGSPFMFPLAAQREPYAMSGWFIWQDVGPKPVYRHSAIEDFYANWEVKSFTEVHHIGSFLWNRVRSTLSAWLFFVGPLLTGALFFLPRVARDRRMRPLLWAAVLTIIGLNLNAWFYAHYAAPAAALIAVVLMQGVRHLNIARPQLVRAIPAIALAMCAVRIAATPVKLLFPPESPMTWYSTGPGNVARRDIRRQLESMPGNHLVVVRYGPRHDMIKAVMNEWVYNAADIDRAKIVWAREMDSASMRRLEAYYPARRFWQVDPDADSPRLEPYFAGTALANSVLGEAEHGVRAVRR